MNIDTGDASYGTLGVKFFNSNKDFILANAKADTVRRGGLGGVVESLCYRADKMPVKLGGHTIGIPGLTVDTSQSSAAMDFECNLGLKALMMFYKVRFNLVDFVLTTYPENPISLNSRPDKAPSFHFTKDKSPSILQTLGFITVGIANALTNPNAPYTPDL